MSLNYKVFLSLSLALATAAFSLSPAQSQTKGEHQSEVELEAQAPDQETALAQVTVNLSVPQMNKAVDLFTAYPYTIKPPRVVKPVQPLPEKAEQLKYSIYNSGYGNRLSLTKPYPDSGWRWQYAYKNALKRAGGYEPKTLIGLRAWQEDMVKYIKPECERINRIELARADNYAKMVQDYEDNHKDEEMEALRLGLEPVPLKFKAANKGQAITTTFNLKPGEWWITGQHRVPGLTYFYMYNIKVAAGEKKEVNLNDTNALLIQGGW